MTTETNSTTAKPALYALDPQAHATVHLALRFYQGMLASLPHPEMRPAGTRLFGDVIPLTYEGINGLCDSLNHTGLDFGPVVQLLGHNESDPYVAAAREHNMLSEGCLEVDVPTIVSRGDDNGAYVMAWLWVEAPYSTLQLGRGPDVPPQEGGSGPDEPVFYFDDDEEFEKAVEIAKNLGLTHTTDSAVELPPDHAVSDASEFESYAKLQTTQPDDDPMSGELCDECGAGLESGQIGLCDDCQKKG